MSDIQPTQPSSASPDPSTPATPNTTTPSTEQSTSASTDDSTKTSKKDETADKIIEAFVASPYVQANPSLETELSDPENKDQVMKGVQAAGKQSRKNKQSLDQANQESEQSIQAYAPPPTDENQPSSSNKKGSK